MAILAASRRCEVTSLCAASRSPWSTHALASMNSSSGSSIGNFRISERYRLSPCSGDGAGRDAYVFAILSVLIERPFKSPTTATGDRSARCPAGSQSMKRSSHGIRRKSINKSFRSRGIVAENLTSAPVIGCVKPSVSACSACREKPSSAARTASGQPGRPAAAGCGRRRGLRPAHGRYDLHASVSGASGRSRAGTPPGWRSARPAGPNRSSTRSRVTARRPPGVTAMRLRSVRCRAMPVSIRTQPPSSKLTPGRPASRGSARSGAPHSTRQVAPLDARARRTAPTARHAPPRSWRRPAGPRCPCRSGARCRAAARRRSPSGPRRNAPAAR